ncbi:twin-arginine translocation signal domain-containing protein [Mycobacterium sp.]|uniref:twin-arginine translocation signal domain-containing protein n=1 Tax=Mycobacterium sp. TaxID=1785 RepID=UPI0031E1E8FC
MSINRRKILGGAGLAGAAAATGVGVERLVSGSRTDKDVASGDDAARFGDPRIPPDALAAVFGVPAATFASFKKIDNAVTILRAR